MSDTHIYCDMSICGTFEMATAINKVDKGVPTVSSKFQIAEKINKYSHLEGMCKDDEYTICYWELVSSLELKLKQNQRLARLGN